MFNYQKGKPLTPSQRLFLRALAQFGVFLLCISVLALPQDSSSPTPSSQTGTPQSSDSGKPIQDAPAAAGGPTDNVEPYAIPKKKPEDAPPPPPVTPKKVADLPDYSL